MHKFSSNKITPYPVDLIKSIILDIESYPIFLPWCKSATILSRDKELITASLGVSFKSFSESYVSQVTTIEKEGTTIIQSKAISGPFKHLNSIWRIESHNNLTKVNFSIDFQLKSKILDIVIGMVLYKSAEEMMVAFELRAKELSK
ncbi:MAG: hypothetical protein DGJ47_000144 [Rickettsiaceae bacterium]